jgi:nicotinamidase-related amidase
MTDNPYHLEPGNCALLVVDIQENLMKVIHGREEVAKKSALLIRAAKTLNIPIVATTQYAARIGELVPEVKAELPGLAPYDKLEFNCFANPEANRAVKSLPPEVNTLIVCGVEAHICIYQTVLGGLISGYRMWVPADAVSSRDPENCRTGLMRMRDMGAAIANTELIIYDLLHKAGTPAFKELLPFMK